MAGERVRPVTSVIGVYGGHRKQPNTVMPLQIFALELSGGTAEGEDQSMLM